MTTLMGYSDVQEAVWQVVADHPDATNPVDPDGFSSFVDPTDPTRRSLAGEVVARWGWDLAPEAVADYPDEAAIKCGWPITELGALLLTTAEILAEPGGDIGAVPWSEVDIGVFALTAPERAALAAGENL